MKVLITGSNGYVGARLFEMLLKIPDIQVFGTYFSGGGGGEEEPSNQFLLDITQESSVGRVFEAVKPDFVVHTAAIAHGELSNDPRLLSEVNVKGTKNVIESARKYNAKIIFVSSVAALASTSEYGKSKLEGERLVQDSFLDFCIVRPSLIIGMSPNRDPAISFNNILAGALNGDQVVLDSEWKFQPSWIDHVCEVIIAFVLGKILDQGPIYPIMPEVKSRFEIASDILKNFGVEPVAIKNPRYDENELIGQESLIRNNLPLYKYESVIETIVSQIKALKGI